MAVTVRTLRDGEGVLAMCGIRHIGTPCAGLGIGEQKKLATEMLRRAEYDAVKY